MNIIIVGCSRVGETLAAELVNEDNNITVIDLSAEKIKNITSRYDVMGIVGNGATHKTQTEAGIDSADLLIAVTDSDELNLLCCMIAKKTGNCRVIARVISPEYNTEATYLKKELGNVISNVSEFTFDSCAVRMRNICHFLYLANIFFV